MKPGVVFSSNDEYLKTLKIEIVDIPAIIESRQVEIDGYI